jgi:glycosyltransferase involved in cell wall biosynthesis
MWGRKRPDLSVVVVTYNIPREIPRTLLSLSAAYQRDIAADDYEVIVVDNGSNPPFDERVFDGLAGNFRLIRIHPASPSPAHAINRGIAAAKGKVIGVMIDGARIVTPGLLHFARHGAVLYPTAIVATLGWYLGHDFQRWSMRYGYNQAREDALLASIAWPEDGYRLFEIATLDESSVEGWFFPIAESNALFMRRELWTQLGGADERFDMPGGGLLNLDTLTRALALPDAQVVIPLGEGTFHQYHGGIATNQPAEQMVGSFERWNDQYAQIRGHRFEWTLARPPTYIGTLPHGALAHFARAAISPVRVDQSPLGRNFDRDLWSPHPIARPADPTIAALVDLAQDEFRAGRYAATAAVARLIRARAPDEPEPQRLLSFIAAGLVLEAPPQPDAHYHFALGQANRLLGDTKQAVSHYQCALAIDRDFMRAHVALADLRLPGELYLYWLDRLYTALVPETVLEIGVEHGQSLARVRPPTRAIGVDPKPRLTFVLSAETHVFAETSNAFFARRGLDPLLSGKPLSIGFIDGLHLFEQALKDFIHIEAYCGPRSIILLHDTLPLDEATQSRDRDTKFHTGDVWKTVLCLKHYRPDLDILTIATPWSGLTVVAGLDPDSRVLETQYQEAVDRFIDTPYAAVAQDMDTALNRVANDWNIVQARLKARGVL